MEADGGINPDETRACPPTSAGVNPTLTVLAQALRAVDQWLRETGAGELAKM